MASEETKVRIGVVGTGRMGQYHVNVSKQIGAIEFVGIFDKDKKQRESVAEKYDVTAFSSFEELLENVDGVIIAAPTFLHYELSIAALKKGVHVLVEKPITTTVAQARKLVTEAEKRKLTLQVGHVERFNGAVQELRNVVTKPHLIEVRRLAPYSGRITDVGVVLDLMIHDIDIVLNLVKKPVKKVSASGVSIFTKHEDVASATIEFEGGTVAVINASRATQEKIRTLAVSEKDAYVFLNYTTQDIEIHRQSSSATSIVSAKEKEGINYRQESSVERVFIHRDNPLKSEVAHFVDCFTGRAKPFVPVKNDVNTLEITQNILKQIHSSKPKKKTTKKK